ncbi:hypothetical protein GBZ48_14360 [Azospirillum melinis]|uniref:Uncharacterized protein n=1 Tax=Azospirillum melinis TaxID=328839 RepID=A0ABX2KIM9_9PROT|nr:hypothetical protein [Azospirillum melinis]MBP2303702.1 hypothetical protein [Azospirillum melinis]NUB00472.1 hypothetical protein [Azospirillum melinis]
MTASVMDKWDFEQLKRRNHDLLKRAREVVEDASRIRQEFGRTATPANAWNARIVGWNKAEDDKD